MEVVFANTHEKQVGTFLSMGNDVGMKRVDGQARMQGHSMENTWNWIFNAMDMSIRLPLINNTWKLITKRHWYLCGYGRKYPIMYSR